MIGKTKDGACIINLGKYKPIGTDWIALFVDGDNVTISIFFEMRTFQKKFKNS